MNKNEYRQFETELEFIIKDNDPSAFKNTLSLSPMKQIVEHRKKFNYMVSKLFDKYSLDNQELFDNFDKIWEEIGMNNLENKELIAKLLSLPVSVNIMSVPLVELLRAYYRFVQTYCIDYAKKQIQDN